MIAEMFQLVLCVTVAVSTSSALYTPDINTLSSRGSPALAHQSLNARAARILIKRQTGDFPASEDGDISGSNTNRETASDSSTLFVATKEDSSPDFSGVGEGRFSDNGGAGETESNDFVADISETKQDGSHNFDRRRVERSMQPKPRRPFGKHGSSRKVVSPSMKRILKKYHNSHIS